MTEVPINQKYALTIKEASAYFSIGIKKMRRMAEAKDEAGNLPAYSVFSGNRYHHQAPVRGIPDGDKGGMT